MVTVAPSARVPTTLEVVVGAERTFSAAPLVLTRPVAVSAAWAATVETSGTATRTTDAAAVASRRRWVLSSCMGVPPRERRHGAGSRGTLGAAGRTDHGERSPPAVPHRVPGLRARRAYPA